MLIGFAHRGARTEHPDNTLPGFARALILGASGLESDAWVTADGIAVLDHDGIVRNGLRRLRMGSLRRRDLPAHIPTLADLYALPGAGDVEVSLDVKDPAAAPAILSAAWTHRHHLWLCSPNLAALAAWRGLDPVVRLVHSSGLRRIGIDVADHPRRLAAAGVDALNLRAGDWTRELVDACHAAGVRAFGWDAQSAEAISDLVRLGLDGLYSDHVAVMVEVLAATGSGSEELDAVQRPHPQDRPTNDQAAGDGPDVA